MRPIRLALAALLITATMASSAVYAQDAFEDAHRSLVAGEVDNVMLSITMGAIGVNAQNEQGYTLLHFAAQMGSLEAVRALLDRDADPTIKANDGRIALDLAVNPEIRAALNQAMRARAETSSAPLEPVRP
jgi:predicted LPLAT superfamily acyltransferase